MNKLNRELMEKWVAALRSGEYKQGKGHLHSDLCETYCCLGVLRDIEPSIWCGRGVNEDLLDDNSLRQHMGGDIQQRHLATMNDNGTPFPEIADYIEKKYLNNEEDK